MNFIQKFKVFFLSGFWAFSVFLFIPAALFLLIDSGPDTGFGGLVVLTYSFFLGIFMALFNGVVGLLFSYREFKIFSFKISVFWVTFLLPIILVFLWELFILWIT